MKHGQLRNEGSKARTAMLNFCDKLNNVQYFQRWENKYNKYMQNKRHKTISSQVKVLQATPQPQQNVKMLMAPRGSGSLGGVEGVAAAGTTSSQPHLIESQRSSDEGKGKVGGAGLQGKGGVVDKCRRSTQHPESSEGAPGVMLKSCGVRAGGDLIERGRSK